MGEVVQDPPPFWKKCMRKSRIALSLIAIVSLFKLFYVMRQLSIQHKQKIIIQGDLIGLEGEVYARNKIDYYFLN